MEVSNKNIYLSHPYTGHEELAKRVAKKYKELLMQRGANSVWSPTEHIPETTSWKDAMRICLQELYKADGMLVLNIIDTDGESITARSRGVKSEIITAIEEGLPIEIVPIKLSNEKPKGRKKWLNLFKRLVCPNTYLAV